eukprot:8667325-Pyramimonas_sp.AAC.1
MGFPCAGDVVDINYAELVELSLMRNRNRLGLLFYGRYRDDIFFIAKDRYAWVNIMAFMRRESVGVYEVKMAEMDYTSVNFLDVTIHQTSLGSMFWEPYAKPGQIKIPLSPSSAHAPRVHAAWPKAEVARLLRRSSSAAAYNRAIRVRLGDMEANGIDVTGLRVPFTALPKVCRRPLLGLPAPVQRIWLKLPYHPLLFKAPVARLMQE